MAKIDHTNFASKLKQSTNPRGSSPNGNVYFDLAGNLIDLITATDLPTLDMTAQGGGASDPNPLTDADGVTMRALYKFETARRRVDENMRKYERGIGGTQYRFSGAFNFINGVKLAGSGRNLIRDSGFIEYANTGDGKTDVDAIYHGVVSLNSIQSGTVSRYAFISGALTEAALQAATWSSFVRTGAINEVVKVFGAAAFGNFDYKSHTLVIRTRSWGYVPGETTSLASGITEFSGFSAGYGIGETYNPNVTETYVHMTTQAPYTGMSLEKVTTNGTGFNEGDGTFAWTLHNANGGTVKQCAEFLDYLALQNADIDSGTGSYNGLKGRLWYSRNASGKVVTASIGGEGLFIEGLSTAEKQNLILTANDGNTRTYPYYPDVQITVGSVAIADTNAWYHVFFESAYDTGSAVTVKDKDGNDIKGNVATKQVGGKISFPFAYDSDTLGGTAGTDKNIVVLVEGDGGAGQALATATITRVPIVAINCIPTTDTNA